MIEQTILGNTNKKRNYPAIYKCFVHYCNSGHCVFVQLNRLTNVYGRVTATIEDISINITVL